MKKYKIFIVSGGTGRTAKMLIKSALTQFPEKETEVIHYSDVRDVEAIKNILNEAKKHTSIITHTLVENNLREFITEYAKNMNIMIVDLLGNVIDKFSKLFKEEPLQSPGLFNKINKEYFQRIDAIQFAFNHDDGARLETIKNAEIILLGVSRTFKTPLSVYLAYKGFFVANIPIINGITPPKILKEIDTKKIFCLTTNANKLSELRKTRSNKLGVVGDSYSDIVNVKNEIQFAMRFYTLHPEWNIINVSGKSIEEIASQILNLRDINL